MAVLAPSTDAPGAAIDAQIAVVQTLVNAAANPLVLAQYIDYLNQLQIEAVDHYMVTGWLNAATILASYSAPVWDSVGQALTQRVTFLQNLYNNAPAMPPGNAEGYGGSGWVTIKQNYQQQLYAAQIQLVEHLMHLPGGTSAATILTSMTGSQSFPYEYKFNSIGYTDSWIDD